MALRVEKGRKEGDVVNYVAKVCSVAADGQTLSASFLRCKSPFHKDTFAFPGVEDQTSVERGQVEGVLQTMKGSTQRLANQVKLSHPLYPFTVR